jgi:YidC/Oxa1 family membrane protein insertase
MDRKENGFMLLDQSTNRVYMAQSSYRPSRYFHPQNTMTLMPGERSLKDGQDELQVRFESAEVGGVKLVKTPDQAWLVTSMCDMMWSTPVLILCPPQLYPLAGRDGNKPQVSPSFYSTFTGPAIYGSQEATKVVQGH